MSHIVHAKVGPHRGDNFDALNGSAKVFAATLEATFDAVLRSQDAPRVSSAAIASW